MLEGLLLTKSHTERADHWVSLQVREAPSDWKWSQLRWLDDRRSACWDGDLKCMMRGSEWSHLRCSTAISESSLVVPTNIYNSIWYSISYNIKLYNILLPTKPNKPNQAFYFGGGFLAPRCLARLKWKIGIKCGRVLIPQSTLRMSLLKQQHKTRKEKTAPEAASIAPYKDISRVENSLNLRNVQNKSCIRKWRQSWEIASGKCLASSFFPICTTWVRMTIILRRVVLAR